MPTPGRSRVRHLAAVVGVVIGGTLLVGACGDDNDNSSSPTVPGGQGDGGSASCDKPIGVDIGDFVFEPDPVRIAAGCSVTWTNTHDQAHTSTGRGSQTWKTGNLAPGDTSDPVTFDQPGSFAYVCSLHPFMKGTVEVTG